MRTRIRRAWRAWRAKARLLAPLYRRPPGVACFGDYRLQFPNLPDASNGPASALRAYDGLAGIWHEYASPRQPDYPAFLDHLAAARGKQFRSVLDLGCGTGVLAARLAAGGREVVGVDASEAMLAEARARCGGIPGVEFVRGDFRDLHLGRAFDAAVCGFNTLNYLSDPAELKAVFRGVAAHLRPGGVFVCDAVTDAGMRLLSGVYLHAEAGGVRFAIWFAYDAARRAEEAEVLLPGGVEVHRRVPIDPADVAAAAQGSGLRVDDYFSGALIPGRVWTGAQCFYVLTRADENPAVTGPVGSGSAVAC